MKYCSECGQCLSDSCDICPICGHGAEDAVSTQKNPYEAEKYVRSGVKYSYVKPKVTMVLIAINVLVYLIITLLNFKGSNLTGILSMHRGAVASGQIYRVITSVFTHRDLFHLLSNCYALYIYGMILEPSIGKIRYLLIYFTGGLLGNMLTFAFMPNPSIGASGAIFGLLGAVIAIYFINPTVMNRMMMKSVVSCVILTTIYSFTGGINNLAHFGGLFGGYMMACCCIKVRHRKKIFTSRALMATVLSVCIVGSAYIGIKIPKVADEMQYGNYMNMCFFASLGSYDAAEGYAKKILSDNTSVYSADASAVGIINGIKTGEDSVTAEALARFENLIYGGYKMMDENIYEDLKRFTAFSAEEGTIG